MNSVYSIPSLLVLFTLFSLSVNAQIKGVERGDHIRFTLHNSPFDTLQGEVDSLTGDKLRLLKDDTNRVEYL